MHHAAFSEDTGKSQSCFTALREASFGQPASSDDKLEQAQGQPCRASNERPMTKSSLWVHQGWEEDEN